MMGRATWHNTKIARTFSLKLLLSAMFGVGIKASDLVLAITQASREKQAASLRNAPVGETTVSCSLKLSSSGNKWAKDVPTSLVCGDSGLVFPFMSASFAFAARDEASLSTSLEKLFQYAFVVFLLAAAA
eukprot:scaffold20589_cov66-Skeletonema_marinoi.AAC.1